MTPPARGRRPRRAALVLALWAAQAGGAHAAGPSPEGSAYDPFAELGLGASGPAQAEPVYRDRIIAAEDLPPLPDDEDERATLAGPPRSGHVELLASRSRIAGESTDEFGLAFGVLRETEGLGALSAEGLVFHGDRARDGGSGLRGRATLWQRGLPMPGGWQVNNSLGAINTGLPTLMRDQYRFFLPSTPLLGAATEWTQRERGIEWQASLGRGGAFNGGLLNGFETGEGHALSLGAGWQWAPGWTGAAAVLATDGPLLPDNFNQPSSPAGSGAAAVFATRWRGERDQVSLQLQASDIGDASAGGAWVDARAERGAATHRYGAFSLGTGLGWGVWPINQDVRGAYYRIDFNRARWSWNAGLDALQSISGLGFEGWYGNGGLRYQHSPRLAYGGTLSARDGRGDGGGAQALQLFSDLRHRGGLTRLQYDLARTSGEADSWEVSVDHALDMREGNRLSLAAGGGQRASGGGTASSAFLGAYGGIALGDSLSLDGSLRWTRIGGDEGGTGLDASVGLRWQIAAPWSLSAQWFENRGPQRSPFVLDPLTNQLVQLRLPNDRTLFFSLRYEFRQGRLQPVLGGPPNAAFGSITGSIFLDDNGDGVRSASERPAVNVTVLLDGRYTARTDSQGRFEFQRVATGSHEITVVPDNLPLPWFLEGEAATRTVEVRVREAARVDLGARRDR